MAATNTNIAVARATWTKIISNVTTPVTFQVLGNCIIKATAADSAPSNFDGGLRYPGNQGETGRTIAELFPGVTGAAYLWAYSEYSASVVVSHA